MSASDHASTAWELVERCFGAAAAAPTLVTSGATNTTFELHMSGARYYLPRYRKGIREAVLREHALIEHVRAHGIPAPKALEIEGSSVLPAADGAIWAVFEAAVGAQVAHAALTEAHVESAGRPPRLAAGENLLAREPRRRPLHLASAIPTLRAGVGAHL